jgi:hypothetical protein
VPHTPLDDRQRAALRLITGLSADWERERRTLARRAVVRRTARRAWRTVRPYLGAVLIGLAAGAGPLLHAAGAL